MDQNILNNHISMLEDEIQTKQNELKTIEDFINKCVLFIDENKEYAPVNIEDNIEAVIIIIKNLNQTIDNNKKDIENIELSQNTLKNVISISSDAVIQTLTKEITEINNRNNIINNIINDITVPLNIFLEIKINCPYCNGKNDNCPLCKGNGIIKLKNIYISRQNTLYSEKNELAKNIFTEENVKTNEQHREMVYGQEIYETLEEKVCLDNSEKINKKTKFVLSRT